MSDSLNHSNDSFKQTDSFRNETTDMSESLNRSINRFIQEINASNVLLKDVQQSILFLFRSVGPTLVNAAKLDIFTGDIMSNM